MLSFVPPVAGQLGAPRQLRTIARSCREPLVAATRKSDNMVKTAIITIIGFCTKYAYITIGVFVLLAAASCYYAVKNFAINTDINTLISEELPWRQRELAFEK